MQLTCLVCGRRRLRRWSPRARPRTLRVQPGAGRDGQPLPAGAARRRAGRPAGGHGTCLWAWSPCPGRQTWRGRIWEATSLLLTASGEARRPPRTELDRGVLLANFGRSPNSIAFGTLNPGSVVRQCTISASTVRARPGFSVTKAFCTSPVPRRRRGVYAITRSSARPSSGCHRDGQPPSCRLEAHNLIERA